MKLKQGRVEEDAMMRRGRDFKSEISNLNPEISNLKSRIRTFHPSSFILHPFFACLVFAVVLSLAACEREKRETRQAPPGARTEAISLSDLHPGGAGVTVQTVNPAEAHAYDVSQGKELFSYYNCAGCHANGGGGIGPALIDDRWIYGSDPANVFSTIVEGRPNGMPSFRGKINDAQVWQLVGFVRAMSGQLPKDVSSTRSDHMNAKKSEQTTEKEKPKNSTPPPETK
ncbi:MAG: cytochrome c oxidase cbb3-type subunit [Acidobacteriota bacterium]|jgi:cytochrome c oxidase cbb3-type subunit 3|nr:cytochrome c oxidase cbb3-type subunit [Acidobacteriota bacterium]